MERHLLAPAALLAARRAALALTAAGLRAGLRHAVARRAAVAARVLPRLNPAPLQARLREARARLEGFAARLEAVSYQAVLARGYAAVFDAAGAPLTSAAAVAPGAALRLRFSDGEVRATAEGGRRDPRQARLPL